MRRRPRRPNGDESVSLFPFLAVLICTMGSLIVLLVVVVQQARVSAQTITTGDAERERENHKQQWLRLLRARAELDDEIRQLKQQQQSMMNRLRSRQRELETLQQHSAELPERINQLRQDSNRLDQRIARAERDRSDLSDQLSTINSRLDEVKSELDETSKAERGQRSYALIPYDGPHGTRRRPIYLECLADRVILRPEGIVLTPDDLDAPRGMDSVLVDALRDIRDYWRSNQELAEEGFPYPLLLVRPSGADTYSMARSAMRSWDAEFGYELLPDEMALSYPDSDGQLAERLRKTIEAARKQQRRYLLLTEKSSGGAGPVFKPARSGGGFVTEGNRGGEVGLRQSGTARDNGTQGNRTRRNWTDSRHGTGGTGGNSGVRHQPTTGFNDSTNGSSSDRKATANGSGVAATEPYNGNSDRQQSGKSAAATTAAGQSSATVPLSRSRGSNWAIPGFSASALGITRPVFAYVEVNRIVISDNPRFQGRQQVIAIHGSARSAIDAIVSTVSRHVESWGIAGPGSYWKPTLKIRVGPGARGIRDELEVLLKGSGISIDEAKR